VVQLMLADGNIDPTRTVGQDFKKTDGVRESIRRRLSALSEQPNLILVIAAAIGNEFDLGL
jgi:predicted ATPase